jgi:diguanylate cyclase (GGDEF)-like protein/PAS domain S-box-containing protein
MLSNRQPRRRRVERAKEPGATIQIDRKLQSIGETVLKSSNASARVDQLLNGLAAVHLGIMIVGGDGKVHVCNSRAVELLDLPKAACAGGFTLADISPALARLEITQRKDPASVVIPRPRDRFIEVRARAMAQGSAVIVIEDRSREYNLELALQQAEAEHRSLFDNSVYGIYRDTLDGKPIRVNPALAALNGYGSEAEHIEAVKASPMEWYVAPGRSSEFRRLLETEGRVKDFVSEIYRHRTRERIWITENAWYVRDAAGNPLFIEGTIQDATERIMAQSEIERLANIDTLTGTSSRFRFFNRLRSETQRAGASCTLFCVDLDRFKEVNDMLGHAAGDAVLKCIGQRLLAVAGSEEWVVRLGGDEFAVLMSGIQGGANAEIVADRIVAALSEPILLDGHKIVVGASVGVAMFPGHASDAESLLHNADLALYQAKSTGRSGHRIFDFPLKESIQQRKDIEQELKTALAEGQFELHYQPIVDARTGTTVSFECLVRWHHPRRGFLPPAKFLAVAEAAGLMADLGGWAIDQACGHAKAFPPEIGVAVNVSASQFRSVNIFAQVRSALKTSGIAPSRLELEVTESVILANAAVAQQVLSELRGLGVRISLDDFGTGYSSLSYLQRFAFNKVKIDRSFVAGMLGKPANAAIIRAVLLLGRDLAIDVVAEGVETEVQRAALLAEGCTLMQGYLFGKPKPFSDAMADLALARMRITAPPLIPDEPACSQSLVVAL